MTSPLQQKLKITGPVVVTANRLGDGAVVYRTLNGNWSTTTNWLNGTPPGAAAGDVANITFNITANRTVTLDASQTLGILNVGDPDNSNTYLINASGGSFAGAFGFFVIMEVIFFVLLLILARDTVSRPSMITTPAE